MSRPKTLKKELKNKVRAELDERDNYVKERYYDDFTDALYNDDFSNAPPSMDDPIFRRYIGRFKSSNVDLILPPHPSFPFLFFEGFPYFIRTEVATLAFVHSCETDNNFNFNLSN